MRKKERHRLITRLLSEQDIQNRKNLSNCFRKRVSVTQATISRYQRNEASQSPSQKVATATAFLKKRQKMSLPN